MQSDSWILRDVLQCQPGMAESRQGPDSSGMAREQLAQLICRVLKKETCLLSIDAASPSHVFSRMVPPGSQIVDVDPFTPGLSSFEGRRERGQGGIEHLKLNTLHLPAIERAFQSKCQQTGSHTARYLILSCLAVTESAPCNLPSCLELARKYGATTVLDLTYQFGALGSSGKGLLDTVHPNFWPEIVIGSLDPVMGVKGQFVCGPAKLLNHATTVPLHAESSDLTESQWQEAYQKGVVIFSDEGTPLRLEFLMNLLEMRQSFEQAGLPVGNVLSMLIPIDLSELADKISHPILVNAQPYPILGRCVEMGGRPHYVFAVTRQHTSNEIQQTVSQFVGAIAQTRGA